MGRNRVIYQSEALFVSPNSTGNHFKDVAGNGVHTAAATGYTDGITGITLRDAKAEKALNRATVAGTIDPFAPVWEVGDLGTEDVDAGAGTPTGGSGAQIRVKAVDQKPWGGAELWDATKTYNDNDIVLYFNTTTNTYELAVAINDPLRTVDVEAGENPDLGTDAVNGVGGSGGPAGAGRWQDATDVLCAGSGTYAYAVKSFTYGVGAGEVAVVKWDGKVYKRKDIGGTANIAADFSAGAGANNANANKPDVDTANWEVVTDAIGYITEVEIVAVGAGYTAADAIKFTKSYDLDDSAAGTEDYGEILLIASVSGLVNPVEGETVIQQLSRVQTANYNFTINRTDVNQFGQLGRIDSLVLEAPTVGLDFSYLLTNGENERLLGFNTNAIDPNQGATPAAGDVAALAFHASEDSRDGQNFFVLTVPEGDDAVGTIAADSKKSVISVGNGYVTDYSVEAAVGGLPTGSITVEAFNIKSDGLDDGTGPAGEIEVPAIDTTDVTGNQQDGLKLCDHYFKLPDATEDGSNAAGTQISALRPGDIELSLGGAPGSGDESSLLADLHGDGAAHIQSFSISCPIGRSVIQRLGNQYGFGRSIDFPVTLSVSINAILSELENANLIERLYENPTCNLALTLNEPREPKCPPGARAQQLKFIIAGCRLESENYSSSIGDNKTVDLSFNAQLGGPNDKKNGLFVYGSGALRNPPFFPSIGGLYQPSKT